MRKYEQHLKTYTKTTLVEITCDLCGKVHTITSNSTVYDIDGVEVEVTVQSEERSSCPGGGWGRKLEIDICPDCFKDVLIPFLRSKGAKIEEQNYTFW